MVAGAPYVIHAILSETGAASFLGSRSAKTLVALASLVNKDGGIDGHPIKVDIQDNQSNPVTAVSLANKLISSGVPFSLNGSIVATDNAVDALAGPNGSFIYDLSPGVHAKPGSSMIFSADASTKYYAEAYLNYLKSKGLTTIGLITSSDATGIDGDNQLKAALAEPQLSSLHIVHQTFDPQAVSVATQLAVIKSSHPQALIVWTTGAPFGVVLHGMSAMGMENLPTLTANGNIAYTELSHFKAILPTNLLFAVPPLDQSPTSVTDSAIKNQVAAFDSAVTSAGGHPSDVWGFSWDPAQLLIGAVKKLGVGATAKQILAYMENLHNVPGIFGVYNTSFSNHRGLALSDISIARWTGDSFVSVSGPGGLPSQG